MQGRLLLRPSRLLNLIVLGVLGRAQRRYGVRIHDFVFMSNHYHLLLSVDSALQLARFMGYFNGNLAKEVARLTGWKDKIWSRRYQAVLVSGEPEAQLARQRYIFRHGMKEKLVESPRHWPGVSSLKAHLGEANLEGLWFDRTQEFNALRQGPSRATQATTETECVELTPLPCLSGLSQAEFAAFVEDVVAEIESEGTREFEAAQTQPPGASAVPSQLPDSRPRRSKRSPAPFAHCASRQERRRLWQAYAYFLGAYLDARENLRTGRLAAFPAGAFPPSLPFVQAAPRPG